MSLMRKGVDKVFAIVMTKETIVRVVSAEAPGNCACQILAWSSIHGSLSAVFSHPSPSLTLQLFKSFSIHTITPTSEASRFCPTPFTIQDCLRSPPACSGQCGTTTGALPTYERQRSGPPPSLATLCHLGTNDIGSSPLPLLQISNKFC